MATGTEGSRAKTMFIVLGTIGVASCVAALGAGLVLQKVAEQTFGPPTWSDDAVAPADFSKVFGVQFPGKPVVVRSRAQGFQDPLYEALVALPPGGRAAFLSANGLATSATGTEGLMGDLDSAKVELRARQPGPGSITTVALDGPKDLESADGGFIVLFRSAVLLEADGETWVYLVAFGT